MEKSPAPAGQAVQDGETASLRATNKEKQQEQQINREL